MEISHRKDERGASAVEYGLLVFAIAAVIALVVFALGNVVSETYSDSCSTLASKASPGAC
ncbi:Flp family type IVb pilin [Nocardioides iriomotensis]|uniref:Flp family type IVb pilin n=1 Tax=Nocardioides iriomotensis TaxID=715784 RepID=A0A4Q5IUK7_9ACTN|nr:Flp family type IVb pilin [Nocardioides iriomotensis]RYU09614.1 Flp family type IVb pilin [Nocardioides iriomotensis]